MNGSSELKEEQDCNLEMLQALSQDNEREWRGIDNFPRRIGQFSAISWAVILHGALLLILIISWQHSVKGSMALQLMVQKNAAAIKVRARLKPNPEPKLNAYLLVTPTVDTHIKAKASKAAKQVPEQVESIKGRLQVSPELTAIEEVARFRHEDSTLKPTLDWSVIEAEPEIEPNTINTEITNKAIDSEGSANKDVRVVIGIPATSKSEVKVRGAGNKLKKFSQQYLERAHFKAIEVLTTDESNRYTLKRSMSELDGEMEPLWVSESKPTVAERIQSIQSLDLGLDPNRRVRVGDTCYQVVKVGTQINPYAENLGYAFNCGGDKVQLQLDKLIAERLNKVR